MDLGSTAKALYSLACLVKKSLDSIKAYDPDSTLITLSDTVSRICTVLIAIQNVPELDPIVLEACLSLGEILSRIKERLLVFADKQQKTLNRAVTFLVPFHVTNMLKVDEHDLAEQLMLMLFLVAVAGPFRGHFPISANDSRDFSFGTIRNKEVAALWRGYVSDKLIMVPHDKFCKALKLWFASDLNDATCQKLLMVLDEFSIGRVSLNSLEKQVENRSLRQFIETCRELDSVPVDDADPYRITPLLVWIDNCPANNTSHVAFAKASGVQVLKFQSVALAKAWIEENKPLLRKYDNSQGIRFISDNLRFDGESKPRGNPRPFLNLTAGENIVRYLRGHFYRTPVLVYCDSKIISTTQYVLSYSTTCSTRSKTVMRNYISSLAHRVCDNNQWQGYDITKRNIVTAAQARTNISNHG